MYGEKWLYGGGTFSHSKVDCTLFCAISNWNSSLSMSLRMCPICKWGFGMCTCCSNFTGFLPTNWYLFGDVASLIFTRLRVFGGFPGHFALAERTRELERFLTGVLCIVFLIACMVAGRWCFPNLRNRCSRHVCGVDIRKRHCSYGYNSGRFRVVTIEVGLFSTLNNG